MQSLSGVIIQLMSNFACAFTQPTYQKMLLLVSGAILAPRQRTIAAVLRVMGMGQAHHFSSYHQVFNRAIWSPWVVSRLLFALMVETLLQADDPIILLIDETIERRQGERIGYKSWFRDPVRSSGRHLSAVMGIRWVAWPCWCHSLGVNGRGLCLLPLCLHSVKRRVNSWESANAQ